MGNELVPQQDKFILDVNKMDNYLKLAESLANSTFLPKAYSGKSKEDKKNDAYIAMMFGAEIGLPPMASVQKIACINGTPNIWGDAAKGLVLASGKAASIKESTKGTMENKDFVATVYSKRADNNNEVTVEFSYKDAMEAGLLAKGMTWKSHPKRMILYKARAFNLRDNFPDVLQGIHLKEELEGEDGFEEMKPVEAVFDVSALIGDNIPTEIVEEKKERKPKTKPVEKVEAPIIEIIPTQEPVPPSLCGTLTKAINDSKTEAELGLAVADIQASKAQLSANELDILREARRQKKQALDFIV